MQRGCYSCGQLGNLTKDCSSGDKKVSSLKGEDVVNVEKRLKKDEKPLICYNCGGRGHTSRQCPSEAFFCRTRRSVGYRGSRKPVRQLFWCKRLVEGQFVNDIVLDTGCSRTLVRSDLVEEKTHGLRKTVTVQCAHGDSVEYPVTTVKIFSVQGKVVMVEAAVSDKLPHSVLLGTDVPELVDLLKKDEKVLMVVTKSQICRLKWNQLEQSREENGETSSDSREVVKSVEATTSDRVEVGEVGVKLVNVESRAEEDRNSEVAEPSAEDVLASEFNFGDDVFVGGERDKGKVREQEDTV